MGDRRMWTAAGGIAMGVGAAFGIAGQASKVPGAPAPWQTSVWHTLTPIGLVLLGIGRTSWRRWLWVAVGLTLLAVHLLGIAA